MPTRVVFVPLLALLTECASHSLVRDSDSATPPIDAAASPSSNMSAVIATADLIPVEAAAYASGAASPDVYDPALAAREPRFYAQSHVLTSDPHVSFSGLSRTSPLHTIRWQLTEGALIARDTNASPSDPRGAIVAGFRIAAHFDLPARPSAPWYAQPFIQVDLSRNLVDTAESTFSAAGLFAPVPVSRAPVVARDAVDPLAPSLTSSNHYGVHRLDAFDLVETWTTHPEQLTVAVGGAQTPYSACAVFDPEHRSVCGPAVSTVRTAFRRVDAAHDYEPVGFADAAFARNVIGAIDSSRHFPMMHTSTRGAAQASFGARHPMWERAHLVAVGAETSRACARDSDCTATTEVCHRALDANGVARSGRCAPVVLTHAPASVPFTDPPCTRDEDCTVLSSTARCDAVTSTCGERAIRCAQDAECRAVDPRATCEGSIGSQRVDHAGLCRLPYALRTVRPIALRLAPGFADSLVPAVSGAVTAWNSELRFAIASARRHECELANHIDPSLPESDADPRCTRGAVLGTDPGGDAEFPLVACHSPVWGTDHGAGEHTSAEVTSAHANGWDLAACGPQGTVTRPGDLASNVLESTSTDDPAWIRASIAMDPDTGEIIASSTTLSATIGLRLGGFMASSVDSSFDVGTQQASPYVRESSGYTSAALDPSRVMPRLDRYPTTLPWDPGGAWLRGPWLTLDAFRGQSAIATRRLTALAESDLESQLISPELTETVPAMNPDPRALLAATRQGASPLRGQGNDVRALRDPFQRVLGATECGRDLDVADLRLYDVAVAIGVGALDACPTERGLPCFGIAWPVREPSGSHSIANMNAYAARLLDQAAALHAIGHALGAPHNFAGSADALNYRDGYWSVRAAGHRAGLAPRWEYLNDPADGHYQSDQELRDEPALTTSSVMDFITATVAAGGPGRYDRAWLGFAYGNVVEAWRAETDHARVLQFAMTARIDGDVVPLDLSSFGTGNVASVHYTRIASLFPQETPGAPAVTEHNRFRVFTAETAATSVDGWGLPDSSNVTDDGHALVAYRVGTDDDATRGWPAERFDEGADPYESAARLAALEDLAMRANAPAAGIRNADAWLDRAWRGGVSPVHRAGQRALMRLVLTRAILAPVSQRVDVGALAVADGLTVALSADAELAMLATPDNGLSHLDSLPDGTGTWITANGPCSICQRSIVWQVSYEPQWNMSSGNWWFQQLELGGSYFGKTLAIEALTDPRVDLGSAPDARDLDLAVSLYDEYPEATLRFLGAVLADDYADFAATLDAPGATSWQNRHYALLTEPRPLDANHRPIDPRTHALRPLLATLVLTRLAAHPDPRLAQSASVWLDGTPGTPSAARVSFTDPWTGDTFVARHLGAGAGEPGHGVGASLLVHPAGGASDETGIAARVILAAADLDYVRTHAGSYPPGIDAEHNERDTLALLRTMASLTARSSGP